MSFALGQRDPLALQRALGQANSNKEALSETSDVAMGYVGGSPTKPTGDRFAGDLIAGQLGINGEFATQMRDPVGQQNVQAFTELLYNGPFSPLPPPVM